MVTVPNALSVLRLLLVPVFLYLLLVAHANGWAVAVLMFSGFSDWADGKIARLVDNQSSRLGELLDPAVDRIYMLTVPLAFGFAGIVPWWIVITLIGRDAILAATLPLLRSRGPDRAAGHLHRQGRDVRAHVGIPVDPARAVGCAVEPRDPGVRVGVRDLGARALPVVGRALPRAGGDGDASDAEGALAWVTGEEGVHSVVTTPMPDATCTGRTRRR